MNRIRMIAFLFLSVFFTTASRAETVLLVQGYLSSPASWRTSGVAGELMRAGIADAGHLSWTPAGILVRGIRPGSRHRFLTLDLPTEAPIDFQSRMLRDYVVKARELYGNDPVALVGFSAGGITARHMMVRYPVQGVSTLITVASPNLGTKTALIGRAIGNSPLSFFAPFFGASTVNRSQMLYHDLSPDNPGTLVGSLNRQPHPKARYFSIIHTLNPAVPLGSDEVTENWRQDLNNVVALRGRATSRFVIAKHALVPADGRLIAAFILQAAKERKKAGEETGEPSSPVQIQKTSASMQAR